MRFMSTYQRRNALGSCSPLGGGNLVIQCSPLGRGMLYVHAYLLDVKYWGPGSPFGGRMLNVHTLPVYAHLSDESLKFSLIAV